MIALNSNRPGRGTSLIPYLGAVVMLRCSSRARSYRRGPEFQPLRTPPQLHLGTSSHSPCRSREVALHRSCLLRHGSLAAAASQQESPEPLGSQGPPDLSQKAPPPLMCAAAHRSVTPGAVAHSEVPVDQWANSRCSCVRCGECEPSII
jgi:hypothetical protein